MPGIVQQLGQTAPKTGAAQYETNLVSGLPFLIPAAAGVTSASVGSIVSIQEDVNRTQYAVLGVATYTDNPYDTFVIVGYGILEESLQSGLQGQIAPIANTFSQGSRVTVARGGNTVFQANIDPANAPTVGIGAATQLAIDVQGRVVKHAAGGGYVAAPTCAAFYGTPGAQLGNQLKANSCFFTFATAQTL